MKLMNLRKTEMIGKGFILISLLALIMPLSANAFELSGQKTAKEILANLDTAKRSVKGIHGWPNNDCAVNKPIAQRWQNKVDKHVKRAYKLYTKRCTTSWITKNYMTSAMAALKKTCAPRNCSGHNDSTASRCTKQRAYIADRLTQAAKPFSGFIFNSCR